MSGETGVLAWIERAIGDGHALYAVLLDPDRLEPAENVGLARLAANAGVDVLLVGGSLSLRGRAEETIASRSSSSPGTADSWRPRRTRSSSSLW
jgi:heptaprenylglyceryl phosphate synthase